MILFKKCNSEDELIYLVDKDLEDEIKSYYKQVYDETLNTGTFLYPSMGRGSKDLFCEKVKVLKNGNFMCEDSEGNVFTLTSESYEGRMTSIASKAALSALNKKYSALDYLNTYLFPAYCYTSSYNTYELVKIKSVEALDSNSGYRLDFKLLKRSTSNYSTGVKIVDSGSNEFSTSYGSNMNFIYFKGTGELHFNYKKLRVNTYKYDFNSDNLKQSLLLNQSASNIKSFVESASIKYLKRNILSSLPGGGDLEKDPHDSISDVIDKLKNKIKSRGHKLILYKSQIGSHTRYFCNEKTIDFDPKRTLVNDKLDILFPNSYHHCPTKKFIIDKLKMDHKKNRHKISAEEFIYEMFSIIKDHLTKDLSNL